MITDDIEIKYFSTRLELSVILRSLEQIRCEYSEYELDDFISYLESISQDD